jgi:hypothetical protein
VRSLIGEWRVKITRTRCPDCVVLQSSPVPPVEVFSQSSGWDGRNKKQKKSMACCSRRLFPRLTGPSPHSKSPMGQWFPKYSTHGLSIFQSNITVPTVSEMDCFVSCIASISKRCSHKIAAFTRRVSRTVWGTLSQAAALHSALSLAFPNYSFQSLRTALASPWKFLSYKNAFW